MQKRMDKGLIRNIKKRGITVDGPVESAGQYYSLEKIQANKLTNLGEILVDVRAYL